MKNILSENMLRFGVKNLSESNKKRLTLESIIQTIKEHGLSEQVRQALTEADNVEIIDLSKDGVIKYEVSSLDKTALNASIDELKQKHPDLKMRVVASSISPDKRITKTIIFV